MKSYTCQLHLPEEENVFVLTHLNLLITPLLPLIFISRSINNCNILYNFLNKAHK